MVEQKVNYGKVVEYEKSCMGKYCYIPLADIYGRFRIRIFMISIFGFKTAMMQRDM